MARSSGTDLPGLAISSRVSTLPPGLVGRLSFPAGEESGEEARVTESQAVAVLRRGKRGRWRARADANARARSIATANPRHEYRMRSPRGSTRGSRPTRG